MLPSLIMNKNLSRKCTRLNFDTTQFPKIDDRVQKILLISTHKVVARLSMIASLQYPISTGISFFLRASSLPKTLVRLRFQILSHTIKVQISM